ncbi:phage holin family protein [Cyclobacterium jeungdonense]|uniref:Phage holin family protein n=1 Tax=Cyclobacterium jeungdonense TaxID=708087 RepID=A0ABT8C9D2_9BACT|nr:phage holin family protein [Cyclobacterium jeungdonense]MDN3688692.1 phage holin family protein [Cyclobacterium jeungdonense]
MPNFNYISAQLTHVYEEILHPKLYAVVTALGLFICQYVFSQWAFAIAFFIIFIMDTFSGSYISWRQKEFSGKIFRDKLMDKCVAYFTIIISFSVATKMLLQESDINLIKYLNLPFYTLFITVELRSIFVKWYRFTRWEWLEKLLDLIDQVTNRNKP